MKITLMYNPKAGTGSFRLEETLKKLEGLGAKVHAQNTKKSKYKKALDKNSDLIIIAGGDGTVEKVILQMKKKNKLLPTAIIPCGNANNIASSLQVDGDIENIITMWKKGNFYFLDIGKVATSDKTQYFLESAGWGLFKELLHGKKTKQSSKSKVKKGLEGMIQENEEHSASSFFLEIDGKDYSGNYIWVEIMNCQQMGPGYVLAPEALANDGSLDVILIRAKDQMGLSDYLQARLSGNATPFWTPLRARSVKVQNSNSFHVDDEIHHPHEKNGRGILTHISLSKDSVPIVNAQQFG